MKDANESNCRSVVKAALLFVLCALPFAQSYGALQIKYMEGTSPENMAEVDAYHLREEMEGWAAEICRSYTATAENPHGSTAAVDDEVMCFSFDYNGVAATGGNTIWLDLPFFRNNPYDARGALVHEMGRAVQGCLSRYLTKQAGADRARCDVAVGGGFECQDYRMFDRALSANEIQRGLLGAKGNGRDSVPVSSRSCRRFRARSSARSWGGMPVSAVCPLLLGRHFRVIVPSGEHVV